MNKNNAVFFPLLIGLFTSLAFIIGVFNNKEPQSRFSNKFEQILTLIENNYVDSINKSVLIEQSITGMLENLDPHSVYIPAKESQLANESLQGHFGGVGIRFIILRDTLMVTNAIIGGPSKLAGLKSGDRIIKVNDELITDIGITNEDVFKLLKGKVGSSVKLTTYSISTNKTNSYSIKRGMIPLPSIDAAFLIKDKIGYIKLSTFSDKTPIEFHAALKELSLIGMEDLILDLRNNSGGYLHGAISVADEFLPSEKLIVYTQGLHQKRQNHYASKAGSFEKGRLAILVNSGSASASEIVAGAIQDNDRGSIIGRRTFGKGLVQQPIKLGDNSELRLTVSRYYSPTGRCIQKPYGEGKNYNNELYERYESGQMHSVDSSEFTSEQKFITPKGKTVYGGGGISPDVFVSIDTSEFSTYFSSIYYSSAIRDYCFDHFFELKNLAYKSIKDYDDNFIISDINLVKFIEYAELYHQIKPPKTLSPITSERIKNRLKNDFASYLFSQESRYYLSSKEDNDIQKALEELER